VRKKRARKKIEMGSHSYNQDQQHSGSEWASTIVWLTLTTLLFTLGFLVGRATAAQGLSDREQEGLRGPVRRVRTEVATSQLIGGRIIDGVRILTQAATFDSSGKMTEAEFHPLPSALIEGLDERTRRDADGNTIVRELYDADGEVARRELWTYAYDDHRNWTRQLVFLETIEEGKQQLEPVRTTYRTISYFTRTSTLRPEQKPRPQGALEKEALKPEVVKPEALKPEVVKPAPMNPAPMNPAPMNPQSTLEGLAATDEREVETRTTAKAINLVRPIYPPHLRATRLGGIVRVGILVDEGGKVTRARAISGPVVLHNAALAAARLSRFEASGARRSTSELIITYNFNPDLLRP